MNREPGGHAEAQLSGVRVVPEHDVWAGRGALGKPMEQATSHEAPLARVAGHVPMPPYVGAVTEHCAATRRVTMHSGSSSAAENRQTTSVSNDALPCRFVMVTLMYTTLATTDTWQAAEMRVRTLQHAYAHA